MTEITNSTTGAADVPVPEAAPQPGAPAAPERPPGGNGESATGANGEPDPGALAEAAGPVDPPKAPPAPESPAGATEESAAAPAESPAGATEESSAAPEESPAEATEESAPVTESPAGAPEESSVTPEESPAGATEESSAEPAAARAASHRSPRTAEAHVAELERAVRGSKRPAGFIHRIRAEAERLRAGVAYRPEFEPLVARLEALERDALAAQEEQVRRKVACCEEAEALRDSTDWRATRARFDALLAEWKAIGAAGREHDEALWQRFYAARDVFFARRSEDLERRAEGWRRAIALKDEICARADAIANSTEWKRGTEEFTALMEAWKAAGSAGREQDQLLWARFAAARAAFFEHRGAHHKQLRHEHEQNRRRKEELCGAAEALAGEFDLAAACEAVKQLQAEWKSVGPASHEANQALWVRFRAACNLVFHRSRGERDQRHAEWVQNLTDAQRRKQEQEGALRESIDRDRGHIERWRATMANLRDDWRSTDVRASLEAKVADVEERLAQKQARLEELTAALVRIAAKLGRAGGKGQADPEP